MGSSSLAPTRELNDSHWSGALVLIGTRLNQIKAAEFPEPPADPEV
ncbi:hypothetical protein [Streptomyces spirodelae]|uniref:Uncharacterized protein n=1 Tax=Streptomyces spirodelae TaxID=2812904 RepID=A0ABS3WM81_9ACTN|nr:hypothetical protein [Streptomyces spirodelae]MBO8184223.1 hypothetical protein [Streptomyces spirodelae]